MTDIKKYSTSIFILIFILSIIVGIVDLFVLKHSEIFSVILLGIFAIAVLTMVFSIVMTNLVISDKKVSTGIMRLNFKIVNALFPVLTYISKVFKMSKDDIRRIYIKLNNEYIYSSKYNLESEDIIILIPHCIQNDKCKLKVTNDIENCSRCGLCSVAELVELKHKHGVKVFIATGGTLARKIIVDNKPKAVIAVACERDLTSGVKDVSKIPVLGVFNKRPNGPCFNTSLDIKDVEDAISFFKGEYELELVNI